MRAILAIQFPPLNLEGIGTMEIGEFIEVLGDLSEAEGAFTEVERNQIGTHPFANAFCAEVLITLQLPVHSDIARLAVNKDMTPGVTNAQSSND